METPTNSVNSPKVSVHGVLAKSYFTFFLAALVGFGLNVLYPIKVAETNPMVTGALMMALGSILILWAQMSSRTNTITRVDTASSSSQRFAHGPYKYLRSPTHIGLTLLVIGYAFATNALLAVIVTFVFSVFARLVFIKKQEQLLEERYGDAYREYKKKVRF